MKNQFILVGNVGQKPELKKSKNGVSYLQFSIAVNERFKPKDSDEYQEKTSWFNLVVYDKKAEGLSKILDKGSKVSVSGKLQTKSQEIEGKKIYTTELFVSQVDVVSRGSSAKEEKEKDEDLTSIDDL